jgi:hypothetical protein
MGKPNPDPLLEAGERLLAQWSVGATATTAELAGVLHRDAVADAAIAHRLGAIASDESARLLDQLEREAHDKRVRKEAKRALYRLHQRGIRPPAAPQSAAAPATAPPIEGYVSPVDGNGDQLVWLVKPQPGGVAHLFAVVNDPGGLREVALNSVTRKALKSIRAELERKHELRLVEVDWHHADYLMHRAFEWARASGARMGGDYPALRAQFSRVPPPAALPARAPARGAAAAPQRDEAQLAQSADLLEEPEFRTWFFGAEQLAPYLEELAGVKDSPLVLNRVQQQERFEAVIVGAIDALFGGDARPSWARRLHEMSHYFAATRRPAQAAQAAAVARALEGGGAAREIPFCAHLVRASLAFFFQAALAEEEEREKTSLVLTPQQALARRQPR